MKKAYEELCLKITIFLSDLDIITASKEDDTAPFNKGWLED